MYIACVANDWKFAFGLSFLPAHCFARLQFYDSILRRLNWLVMCLVWRGRGGKNQVLYYMFES